VITDDAIAALIKAHDDVEAVCPGPWEVEAAGLLASLCDSRGEQVGRVGATSAARDMQVLRFVMLCKNNLIELAYSLLDLRTQLAQTEGLLRDMAEDGKAVDVMRRQRFLLARAVELMEDRMPAIYALPLCSEIRELLDGSR
jgi:hypothetical protein